MHQVAWADRIQESRWVIAVEGVFHRIEVIQIPPILVEAVDGRQKFIAITQVIFAELAGGVAHRSQHCCDGRRLRRHPSGGTGLSDCRKTSPNWQFTSNEVRASGGTTRFRVIVGKAHALAGHPVEIGRSASHDALIVDANIRPTDVIAHDDNDVWPLPRWSRLCLRCLDARGRTERRRSGERGPGEENVAPIYFWTTTFFRRSHLSLRGLRFELTGQKWQVTRRRLLR